MYSANFSATSSCQLRIESESESHFGSSIIHVALRSKNCLCFAFRSTAVKSKRKLKNNKHSTKNFMSWKWRKMIARLCGVTEWISKLFFILFYKKIIKIAHSMSTTVFLQHMEHLSPSRRDLSSMACNVFCCSKNLDIHMAVGSSSSFCTCDTSLLSLAMVWWSSWLPQWSFSCSFLLWQWLAPVWCRVANSWWSVCMASARDGGQWRAEVERRSVSSWFEHLWVWDGRRLEVACTRKQFFWPLVSQSSHPLQNLKIQSWLSPWWLLFSLAFLLLL